MKKSSDSRPGLKVAFAALGSIELYFLALLVVAAFIVQLSSLAVGRNPLDPSIFPYLTALGAIVIGLDMTVFFTKRRSPVFVIALGIPVIIYITFCQVMKWRMWVSFIGKEIDETLHTVTRFSHMRFV